MTGQQGGTLDGVEDLVWNRIAAPVCQLAQAAGVLIQDLALILPTLCLKGFFIADVKMLTHIQPGRTGGCPGKATVVPEPR